MREDRVTRRSGRAGSAGRLRWSRLAAYSGAVLAAGGLSACGGTSPPVASPTATTPVYGQGDLANIHCTGAGAAKACGGLVPAPAGVTDTIVLDHPTVPTGTDIGATVVVVNRTGHAIALLDPHGCRPSLGVSVTNATVPPAVGFSLPCASAPLVLAPGTTRFPTPVITSAAGCSPTPAAHFPRCTAAGVPPDLPVGSYHAVLVGLELALPPASVPVTLTAHR